MRGSGSRRPSSRARQATWRTASSSGRAPCRSPRPARMRSATSWPRCVRHSTLSVLSAAPQRPLTGAEHDGDMTHTTLITVNAVLDLALVFAVFAIVRLTQRLDRDERRAQTIPVAFERATQDLSEAA